MHNIDDVEFDIQKTILKKKQVKSRKFYVEYDKLTYQVLGISPYDIEINDPRRSTMEIEENDIIYEIFNSKTSLHKLKIKYDVETNTRMLYKRRDNNHRRGEFDYVYGEDNDRNFIHLHCDLISKKINVNFIYDNFKQEYTKERTTEDQLSNMPDNMEIFCIDKKEPSRLYDTLRLNVRDLFSSHEQVFACKWLPDDASRFDNLGFLHYNHNFNISIDQEPYYIPLPGSSLKPTLVYKQTGNKIQVQSIFEDAGNFNLDKEITFYMYNSNDPSEILDTITLNTNELDNFALVELKLKTNKPVKMISNYHHLHIEDTNVSTYYKF